MKSMLNLYPKTSKTTIKIREIFFNEMIHKIFKNVKTDTEKHSSNKKKAQVRLLLKYVSKITSFSNVVNDMCRCFLNF